MQAGITGLDITILSMLIMSAFDWETAARGIEKGALSERGAPFS
jgi:hypothetical protein